jgi:hypothetical protein
MLRFSARARKYLFCVGGIGLLIAAQQYDLSIPGLPDMVRDMIMGLLVAEGVFQAPNSEA